MRERRQKRATGRLQAGSSSQGQAAGIPSLQKANGQATASQQAPFAGIFVRPSMTIAVAAFLLCSASLVLWYGEQLIAFPISFYNNLAFSTNAALPNATTSHDAPQDAAHPEVKQKRGPPREEQTYRLKVVKRYPHDEKAYTQGLVYLGNNTLYESTGLHGQSSLRKVDLHTGHVLDVYWNARNDFGEGVAYYKGFLWQLVWRKRIVYQYDARTLQLISTRSMPKEFDFDDGWGLASSSDGRTDFFAPGQLPSNEEALFVTDGGTKLYRVQFRDGAFKLAKAVTIHTDDVGQLEMANELEVIRKDEIWANIYSKDCIARVNPYNGKIFGWILADHLRREERLGPRAEVFNGIAYDRNGSRIFVTGKLWNQLFEVRLVPERTMTVHQVMEACVPANNLFHG
mmetsp:Transcript_104584/g.207673  ORF Transcript_104584/g.207673 Transcript_104584/m.207673 type:complete len:400 (-) Transcript_104584:55-1254(-)